MHPAERGVTQPHAGVVGASSVVRLSGADGGLLVDGERGVVVSGNTVIEESHDASPVAAKCINSSIVGVCADP